MRNKVSMQDIADSIGISKVTVSKVLRGKTDVSESMSKKVMAAAERLGYVYDSKATKSPLRIAVLSAEHFLGGNDCFYVKLYKYLSEELEKLKIDPILIVVDQRGEAEIEIPDKLKNRNIDGIIIMGQLSREYIQALASLKIPIVFLDFYYDDLDVTSINTDNFFCQYQLTNQLIRLGHTKIAFVGTLEYTSSIQDRFLGYYKALIEHHIPLNSKWVLNDRDQDGRYLDIVLPEEMPTAFACNCDEVAMLLIRRLTEKGYRVPNDIAVSGFDDSIHSLRSVPSITTVHVKVVEMAHLAVQAILREIGSNKHKNRILVRGEIIFRDSTAE